MTVKSLATLPNDKAAGATKPGSSARKAQAMGRAPWAGLTEEPGGKRPVMSMRPDLSISEDCETSSRAPRTMVVLILLVGAAAMVSFLGSYPLSEVLVKSDIIPPWPATHDPRPKWMGTSFLVMLGVFTLVAGVARQMSRSQLKKIDRMAD